MKSLTLSLLVFFNSPPHPSLSVWSSSSHLLTRLAVSPPSPALSPTEPYSVSTKQDSERWAAGSNLSLFGGCQHTGRREGESEPGRASCLSPLKYKLPNCWPICLTYQVNTHTQTHTDTHTPAVKAGLLSALLACGVRIYLYFYYFRHCSLN